MNVEPTALPEVLLISPRVFKDDRGLFTETFHAERYGAAGITQPFVQDNASRSIKGTLRGLHFQQPNPQGKLVFVVRGAIFDVAVDIRRDSPNFGRWIGVELDEENRRQLWVPPGFAHGFLALSPLADVVYKCTALYSCADDRGILWSDPDIGIAWPLGADAPLLSPKDAVLPRLKEAKY
jgi:dTDP-4-dehydrorhamnose 3,5-epimerase